jgi:hypothetical protein
MLLCTALDWTAQSSRLDGPGGARWCKEYRGTNPRRVAQLLAGAAAGGRRVRRKGGAALHAAGGGSRQLRFSRTAGQVPKVLRALPLRFPGFTGGSHCRPSQPLAASAACSSATKLCGAGGCGGLLVTKTYAKAAGGSKTTCCAGLGERAGDLGTALPTRKGPRVGLGLPTWGRAVARSWTNSGARSVVGRNAAGPQIPNKPQTAVPASPAPCPPKSARRPARAPPPQGCAAARHPILTARPAALAPARAAQAKVGRWAPPRCLFWILIPERS